MSALLKQLMSLLAVKTAPAVNLDATLTLFSLVGNVQLRCDTDGNLLRTALAFVGVPDNYVDDADKGAGVGDLFECRLQQTGGTAPSGPALNTFHQCNVARTWTWAETDEFDGTLTVREIANPGTNVASATIDVNDNP